VNFDRLYNKAESGSGFFGDRNYTRIYISAFSDDLTLQDISNAFSAQIEKNTVRAELVHAGSSGYYDLEPIVRIDKPDRPSVLFRNVTAEIAGTIVEEFIVNDRPVGDITLGSIGSGKINGIPDINELSLFSLQNRIALRNCSGIDPGKIDHYILGGKGFLGLAKVLNMVPNDVISELRKSGLRGKGGAGYSTADKWQTCLNAENDEKYVVCNAVDDDPDSQTARLLLESDPYSVLEGMLIAAYTISAPQCYICLNSRNSGITEKVNKALEQMKEYDLIGENILDSGFSCTVNIHEEVDSLVSGEETALIRSIEGKQPMPYLKTIDPAVSGIEGKPTLINNLETLACVSAIFQNGVEWYTESGTQQSPGTKVITVSDDAAHKYTVEVPFGTSLETVVNDIGDGTSSGKAVKAVRFGGPTGRFFDVDSLDTRIDFESMKEAGAILGSGVVKIYDDSICAVETLRDLVDYLHDQSCGKCVFCREGSLQIFEILKDISENNSRPGDLDLVTELCEAMKEGSICGLGTNIPNPVLSSINLFGSDYDTHIYGKKCPAGQPE
jgi:NADH-quinone oxidoreductase subunit F